MKKQLKKISLFFVALMVMLAMTVPVYAATKINKTKATVCMGQSFQLKISGAKSKITWSSDKKDVAAVSQKGKVTARKKGTATITAKMGKKKYTCKVTVESPQLSKTKVTLNKGKSVTLAMKNTKQKYTWSSSNKSVAVVNSKGKVTAKRAGSAKIKAKSASGKTFTCQVTVKNTGASASNSAYAKQSEYKTVVRNGYTETLYYNGSLGTTYKSTNTKIFKITSSDAQKVKIKAVGNGTAYLLAKQGNKTSVCTIVVASGESFAKQWVKETARQVKAECSSTEDRLVYASMIITGSFSYGTVSYRNGLQDVIAQKEGTCHSAGLVLAETYKAMGYTANVRSAIKDDMSRYPSGIMFGSDHYNVKVVADKKTYYLDATPESGFVYLSSSTKPLRYYMNLGSGWMRIQ